MPEDPIKLFSSRAEQLPQPDDQDRARAALEKIVEQVPILGPAAVYILNQFLVPAQQLRLDEWLRGLSDDLEEEQRKNIDFRAEYAFGSESFITATLQATRIAVSTHQHEKRVLLHNALMNIATGRAPGEDMQHIYLRLIDELTPSHVKILDFLWRGNSRVAAANGGTLPQYKTFQQILDQFEPAFQKEHQLVQQVLSDLRSRGLATLQSMSASFPQQVIADPGIQFLRFVSTPEELQ
jgi:hypothetical protein